MFLDLPHDVICNVACFRLRVNTLRYETATWNPSASPHCDLCGCILYLPISSSKTFLIKLDATPAALMLSWSPPTQVTQTHQPFQPHTGYCAVWGIADR
eukprot:1144678-Pelagomonas_calceolata.AAC.2